MKKAALVLALALTFAACGGNDHDNCKDCNATDSTAVDTTKVDTVAVANDSATVK